jgi:hypothetical protein
VGELLRRGNFLNHSSLLYRAVAKDAVLGMRPPWIDYRLHVRLASRGALAYVDAPLVVHRWRTPGSMIRTMPNAVLDGHIDAFAEALALGAPAPDVRRAAGHAWCKVLVQGVAARDLTSVRYFTRRLRALPGVEVTHAWLLAQIARAPARALQSWVSRKRGIYFP